MLHVCSIFVWIMIKIQRLPLILHGKSADKPQFIYMNRFILFLFNFDLVLLFDIFELHKEMFSILS